MSNAITSRQVGLKLAEALGVPTHMLKQFSLHVPANGVVTVEATYIANDNGTLIERVQRLHLHAEQE